MAEADKKRELFVSQQVADAINALEGADYFATTEDVTEPADVLLRSASGVYGSISIQVVTTPLDGNLRWDTKNYEKFQRKLADALAERNISGCVVEVAWTKKVSRYGIRNCDRTLIQLAGLIAESCSRSNERDLRIGKAEMHGSALYDAVDFVRIFRVPPHQILQVDSCAGGCRPSDGRWIEEAIAKKSGVYPPKVVSGLTLVIDGKDYVDGEQVAAFRAANPPGTTSIRRNLGRECIGSISTKALMCWHCGLPRAGVASRPPDSHQNRPKRRPTQHYRP